MKTFGLLTLMTLCLRNTHCSSLRINLVDLWKDLQSPDLFENVFVDLPEVSKECIRDYRVFVNQTRNPLSLFTEDGFWAAKMYDSYGKFPNDGELRGNFFHMGSFYSCLEVEADKGFAENSHFRGHYCSTAVSIISKSDSTFNFTRKGLEDGKVGFPPYVPPFDSIIGSSLFRAYITTTLSRFGMCLPSTCSFTDVHTALVHLSLKYETDTEYLYIKPLQCQVKGEIPPLTAGDIVMLCVLAAFVALVIAGTIFDVCMVQNDKKPSGNIGKLSVAFSAYTNTKKLLSTTSPKGNITCLDGLRFLSMSWVLMSHSISISMGLAPVQNLIESMTELTKPFLFRVILNGYICVDSFLLISGFLVGFLTFKELDKRSGRLNVPMYYLHRYVRLSGAYAILLGFHSTLYRYLAVGPNTYINMETDSCQKSWWRNLVYINNFQNPSGHYCIVQTWYLAAEMQMFVVSPLMTIPMWWIHKKLGKVWTAVYAFFWLTVFTIVLLVLTIVRKWPTSSLVDTEGTDYTANNYLMAWTRCQPYIVGIMFGFLLNQTKNVEIRMNKWLVSGIWASAAATALAICYSIDVNAVVTGNDSITLTESVFFNAFHRLAWGACVGWVIFACFHGYGGWANTFLSWKAFAPLSRLSFMSYLTHKSIINVLSAQFSFNFEGSHLIMVMIIFTVFVITTVVSAVVELIVEMPLLISENIFFSWIFGLFGAPADKTKKT